MYPSASDDDLDVGLEIIKQHHPNASPTDILQAAKSVNDSRTAPIKNDALSEVSAPKEPQLIADPNATSDQHNNYQQLLQKYNLYSGDKRAALQDKANTEIGGWGNQMRERIGGSLLGGAGACWGKIKP